jgi:serine/threonine protein kinase
VKKHDVETLKIHIVGKDQ